MIEQTVDIPTRDGTMATFIVHPERGAPHPIVLFFMDAYGVREELRDMCRRIASVGYYVMLPTLYYRHGVIQLRDMPPMPEDQATEKILGMMASLTIPMVMDDTDALLDFADRDPAASNGPAAAVGYCMSGQYAVNAAARHPERIAAAASVYGVKLVTDQPDSPHIVAARTQAELYFAWAEKDEHAPVEMVPILDAALKAAGIEAEVEVYPGADHGFAFPRRPGYHKPSAERHWERLLSLFARRLPYDGRAHVRATARRR